MATARRNFVFGLVPGVTRPSGAYFPFTRAVQDPLREFIVRLAAGYEGDPQAAEFAKKHPEDMLDVFLRQHSGYVVMVIGGDVTLYSTKRRVDFPPRLNKYLADMGINKESQVHWYPSAYSAEASDIPAMQDVPAGDMMRKRLVKGKLTPAKIADLRRKFWAGQTDPEDAEDIVDILVNQQ